MAKKKKEYVLPPEDPGKISFDLDAVIEVASITMLIRNAIETKAIEISSVRKCIPKSDIREAAKRLGLGKWVED